MKDVEVYGLALELVLKVTDSRYASMSGYETVAQNMQNFTEKLIPIGFVSRSSILYGFETERLYTPLRRL